MPERPSEPVFRSRFLYFAGLVSMLAGCNQSAPAGIGGQESSPSERPAFLDTIANAPVGGSVLAPGSPRPSLDADGWIDAQTLDEGSLDGKIVVVEAWAHW